MRDICRRLSISNAVFTSYLHSWGAAKLYLQNLCTIFNIISVIARLESIRFDVKNYS